MIKSYNQFCCGQSNILYFDTTFTSPSHALQNYDIDSLFSAIYYEHSSPVMIMTTTIPVTYVATSSAVRTTTSNELTSTMTIYDIYFNTTFDINTVHDELYDLTMVDYYSNDMMPQSS